MRSLIFWVAGAAMLVSVPVFAGTKSTPKSADHTTLTTVGDATAIAVPLLAGGIALYKHDWTGMAQLAVEGVLTVGTAYALKNIVRERRPNGADYQSFPSGTTAVSAAGSSFLWGRYGWEYGLPAFMATEFVSYTRVRAKEHHWYDTLASSAIAAGYGLIVTTPFKERYGIDTELSAAPDGAAVRFSYKF